MTTAPDSWQPIYREDDARPEDFVISATFYGYPLSVNPLDLTPYPAIVESHLIDEDNLTIILSIPPNTSLNPVYPTSVTRLEVTVNQRVFDFTLEYRTYIAPEEWFSISIPRHHATGLPTQSERKIATEHRNT